MAWCGMASTGVVRYSQWSVVVWRGLGLGWVERGGEGQAGVRWADVGWDYLDWIGLDQTGMIGWDRIVWCETERLAHHD